MGKTYRGLHRIGNTSQHGEAPEVIIETENITVIPSKNEQIIKRSEGKYIDTATIKPIPDEYIVPEGVLEVKENGTYDVTNKETVDVEVPSEEVVLQDKTVVPTKERQVVTADEGYDGLKSTAVEPIPDEYIVPEGTLNIAENGSYNVKDKETVNVEVPGEVVNLQNKSVTPTKEPQNVSADQGYTGLGTVEVGAIPNEYIIPSGNIDITENQVVDVTQYSQATISVATGGGSGEEDVFGAMLKGTSIDYVDTQRIVTVVETSAMKGMNQFLNSIELPVCSIVAAEAFAYYSTNFGLKGLRKASLPACTSIGQSAFSGCWNLSEIYAPLLASVGSYAFQNCTNLRQLDFPNLSSAGSQAFSGCGLTSINLPNLQIAGSGAFTGCKSVVECSFPELVEIGIAAFSYNSNMTSFYAPKLVTLSGSAFAYCNKLSSLVVDYANLKTVPSYCFISCLLSSFDAPNCLKIGQGAFASCSVLVSVNFPKVSNMDGAFSKCTALRDVNLPMCSYIGTSAFAGCTSLSRISLPSVSRLYSYVFSGCTSLSILILTSSSMTTLANSAVFNNTPIKSSGYLGRWGSIYVPADLVDTYKGGTNWTYYSDRITSIENLPTT